jgi:hypothetical protein
VFTRRPGNCWLPSPSTESKGTEKKRRKTVGDVDTAAPKLEPGIRKIDDKLLAKDIGKLVKDVSVYEGVAASKMKSMKALTTLANQIGADPEAAGGGSLTVDSFKAVTRKRAISMLVNAENSRIDENARESNDNNIRFYTKDEAAKIVDHLLAQSGRGGKLFVAEWDDISSEYIGLMLAAVKPDELQATFGQVICFRP